MPVNWKLTPLTPTHRAVQSHGSLMRYKALFGPHPALTHHWVVNALKVRELLEASHLPYRSHDCTVSSLMENNNNVLAQLSFLARDPLYDSEKPYNLSYDSDTVPKNNIVREIRDDVLVHDIRGREHELTFERNGIAVLELESEMRYTDFDHAEKIVDCYLEEISQLLYHYMNPKSVQIFDYNIRRRHPDYPNIPGNPLVDRSQPTANCHVDATGWSTLGLMKELNGSTYEPVPNGRVMFVNIWRALRGPVMDWPLTLCDAATLDAEHLVPTDHVIKRTDTQEGRVVENCAVRFDVQQRWLYLSNQQPSELLVFRQWDSNGALGVAHSSFQLPAAPRTTPVSPRESIEVRALVYF